MPTDINQLLIALDTPVIEAQRLTQAIRSTNDRFGLIINRLGAVGAKGKLMLARWEDHKVQFHALLLDSHVLAVRLATEIELFYKFTLPKGTNALRDASPTVQIELLQNFLSKSEPMIKDAEKIAERYNTLVQEVNETIAKLEESARARHEHLLGWKKKLDPIIESAKSHKAEIFAICALATLIFMIAMFHWQGARSFVEHTIRNMPRQQFNFKTWSVSLERIVLYIKGVWTHLTSNEELKKAQADHHLFTSQEIKNITTAISNMGNIWKRAQNDHQALEMYLAGAHAGLKSCSDNRNHPVSLPTYLSSGVTTYAGLARALRAFASGINEAL